MPFREIQSWEERMPFGYTAVRSLVQDAYKSIVIRAASTHTPWLDAFDIGKEIARTQAPGDWWSRYTRNRKSYTAVLQWGNNVTLLAIEDVDSILNELYDEGLIPERRVREYPYYRRIVQVQEFRGWEGYCDVLPDQGWFNRGQE